MQYLLTMFLIFLIIFLVSFVTNLLEIDKKLDEKTKSKYAECIDEIALVDEAIIDDSEDSNEYESTGENLEDEEQVLEDEEENIEENDENQEEYEEAQENKAFEEFGDEEEATEENEKDIKEEKIDIEKVKEKKKAKFEKEIVSFSIEKAFEDLSRNSGLLLIFIGIMSLVLEGISIGLNNFDFTVEKAYVILLTTFFLLIVSKLIIRPVVISFGSDILAHNYLSKGIEDDEDEMKKAFERDKLKIKIANFICIFVLSFIIYFVISGIENLGNRLIDGLLLAVVNTVAYRFMFEVQYD